MSASPGTDDGRTRILIVEDSPTQAEMLKHLLTNAGYEVIAAANGKEALTLLETTFPKLILSDIVMPEMDGYELCRTIKHDERLKKIPVILVTALYDPRDVIQGLESGADNFIIKPYEEKYLLSRVEIILAGSQAEDTDVAQMGLDLTFSSKTHHITSTRLQILNILLSTYETAIQKNQELNEARTQLRTINEHLEDLVAERTKELEIKNQQLSEEIDARKKVEENLLIKTRAYKVISEGNQFLVRTADELDLTNGICAILVTSGGYRAAWVGYARGDETKSVEPVAQNGFEEGYINSFRVSWREGSLGRGPTGKAIRTGKPEVIHDIPRNPKYGSWIGEALRLGYSSVVAFPLMIQGEVMGALTVYSNNPNAFDPDEMRLLSELSEDLAYGIETLRNREAHKLAVKRLETSETRYRRLFEAAKDGILILDYDSGEIFDANPFILDLLGYSHQSILGRHLWDIGLLKDTSNVKEAFSDLKKEDYIRYEDLPLATKNGVKKEIEFISNVYLVNDRKVIQCSIRDITERKKMEEDLRKTTAYLRNLIRYANAPIIVWDPQIRITEFNHASEVLTGINRDNAMGKNLEILFPEESRNASMDLIHSTTGGERLESVEIPICHVSGDIRAVLWNSSNILSSEGATIATIAQGQDITDRKRAEQDLEFRNLILSTQLETTIDGLLIVDEQGKIILYNQRFCQMWGIPKEIMEGRSDELVMQFVKDFLAHPQQFVERVNYLYTHKLDSSHDEISLKDGRSFERYTAPMIAADNTYYGRVWYFRDITERMMMEKQKVEALVQIEQNLEQLAALNDEIRNPLTIIVGLLELEETTTTGEKILNAVHTINDLVSRLDQGWVESDKVRSFLKKHYDMFEFENNIN